MRLPVVLPIIALATRLATARIVADLTKVEQELGSARTSEIVHDWETIPINQTNAVDREIPGRLTRRPSPN